MSNMITIDTLAFMARAKGWSGTTHSNNQGRLRPIAWPDLDNLPKRKYLIKWLLDKGGMSVVFGESNSGKTFLALDMALHIVLGMPWYGLKIQQGAVVYIATEGGVGLADRLNAYRIYYGLTNHPSFYLIPASVDLCNADADCSELIEEISQIPNVSLVVIDTLSRAMSGGNENSPDDMGAVIRNGDRLKEELGVHIMFIHHSGKDSTKGARGHSALRAAVDTEIEVKKTDSFGVVATVTKQRDGKTGDKYGFLLKPVPIGIDEDGEAKQSCVLIPCVEASYKSKELSGQPKTALNVLRDLLKMKGEVREIRQGQSGTCCILMTELQDALKSAEGFCKSDKSDSAGKAVKRAIASLITDGFVGTYNGFVWAVDKLDKSDIAAFANFHAGQTGHPPKGVSVSGEADMVGGVSCPKSTRLH